MNNTQLQSQTTESNNLLQLIPKLSAKQKAYCAATRKEHLPFYRLLRDPVCLYDFDWKKHRNIAIWRDNKTLLCVGPCARRQTADRKLFFSIHFNEENNNSDTTLSTLFECAIYGNKDVAIAETAVWFWSLIDDAKSSRLEVMACCSSKKKEFKWTALSAEQLAQVMDANPTRQYEFQLGCFTPEQCTVLASRPYPIQLKLTQSLGIHYNGCQLAQAGTAFVDALERREACFGSLTIDYEELDQMPFSRANLYRMFHLERNNDDAFVLFETFSCSFVDEELVLHPFRLHVNSLRYEMDARQIEPQDLDPLQIVTRDLQFRFFLGTNDEWEGTMISFLNRVAALGHLERFGFAIDCGKQYRSGHELKPVAEALALAIHSSLQLTYLNLGDSHGFFDWAPYLETIFQAIQEHENLRTVILNDRNWKDVQYIWLEKLLSRNRDITVLDPFGNRISNGPALDSCYLLNDMYHGLDKLTQESTAMRPLLVETALVKSTCKKFPHMALLLANQEDVLCESLLGVEEYLVVQSRVSEDDAVLPVSQGLLE